MTHPSVISRVVVVGLGSIGLRHLKLLRAALPHADIRVLRHSSNTALVENANGVFQSLNEACAFEPQLAIISNPAPFHLSVARALADAGAHLLIEKPISDSVDGVQDLITLCALRDRQLQVGYNLRFLKSLEHFRKEISNGTIGAVHAVHCEIGQYLPDWRPNLDYRRSVSARAELGGGVLLELSHEFDMLRWVFGEIDWLGGWIGRQSHLEINVEDFALVQMQFLTGPVAQLSMNFLRRDPVRQCTAIGASGTLRWDAIAGRLDRFVPDENIWIEVFSSKPDRDESYRAQIDALISVASGNKHGLIAAQGWDGLVVLQLIDAVRKSNEQGGARVKLDCRS